jgi:hypothetical protein
MLDEPFFVRPPLLPLILPSATDRAVQASLSVVARRVDERCRYLLRATAEMNNLKAAPDIGQEHPVGASRTNSLIASPSVRRRRDACALAISNASSSI